MFEDITFETILNRMLAKVPDNYDKREGSVIYNALAPAAVELQLLYIEADVVLQEVFADTASREYLILRAAERGLAPYEATKSIVKAVVTPSTITLTEGDRFNLDEYNYSVYAPYEENGTAVEGTYLLQCETAGADSNYNLGFATPIDYIEGLQTIEITECVQYGSDIEDTEDFRQRYLESLNTQAFGGNVADYKQRVKALDGVGQVRVYRADEWNGGGTVKLVITDTDNGVPTTTLISYVQEAVDPIDNQGTGNGFAPIGHIVTVAGVNSEKINVTATVTLTSGSSLSAISPYIKENITNYLNSLNAQWEDIYDSGQECIKIPVVQIVNAIMDTPNVTDIPTITITSGSKSAGYGETLTLAKDYIAELDTLSVEVD